MEWIGSTSNTPPHLALTNTSSNRRHQRHLQQQLATALRRSHEATLRHALRVQEEEAAANLCWVAVDRA